MEQLQTTLTPAQKAVAVALRKTLLVSLDGLLAVVREFLNPNVSRSGLDRCLRRHGVGNLRDLKVREAKPKHSTFKAYEPGYLHIDVKYLPQMADEAARRYCSSLLIGLRGGSSLAFIGVTFREVVWLFLEQLRFEFVPVFHDLQGCFAA